jgi:hypothetical protein
MSWLIVKLINGLPVPIDMRQMPEADAKAELARLRAAEPSEQFIALAVL